MKTLLQKIANFEIRAAMRVVAFGWWWADRALHRGGHFSEQDEEN